MTHVVAQEVGRLSLCLWKASGRFQQCSLSLAPDRSIASNNVWRSAVIVRGQSFVRVIGWNREECHGHVQFSRESETCAAEPCTSLIRILISALPCQYLCSFRTLIGSFAFCPAHSKQFGYATLLESRHVLCVWL